VSQKRARKRTESVSIGLTLREKLTEGIVSQGNSKAETSRSVPKDWPFWGGMQTTAKWLNYSKNVMRLEHKVNASPDGKGACDMSAIWGALCSVSRGMGGSGGE